MNRFEQKIQEALDVGKFRAYLEQEPGRQFRVLTGYSCPVATYLVEQVVRAGVIHVAANRIAVTMGYPDDLYVDTPVVFKRFIHGVDNIGRQLEIDGETLFVDASQCLAVLDKVVKEVGGE